MAIFAGAIAGWTLKKVAPYLAIAVLAAALVGLWVWDQHTIDSLRAEKVAAIERAEMASADANRWAKAAEDRRAAIERLNAEVEKQRADLAQAEAILETADAVARAEAEDLNAEIAKWKRLAHDRPQDVRPTGPIAVGAWCQRMRAIGQLPAGCDPAN